MDVGTARVDIGSILRGARCAARLTQAQVGQACGYSASAVSRIESGRMRLDHHALAQFAAFLNVPLDRLAVTPVPGPPTVDTVERPSDEEDAVRRRELLTGVLAAGATAVVSATPVDAASGPFDPAAGLEDALFRLPSAAPAPCGPALFSRQRPHDWTSVPLATPLSAARSRVCSPRPQRRGTLQGGGRESRRA